MVMRALFYLALVASSFSVPLHAQNALWRTVSEEPPQISPSFSGNPSPFPFRVRPNEKTKAEIEAEKELSESSRVKSLKADILGSLGRGVAIAPNLSDIQVRGFLKGESGPRVLVGREWLSPGDKLKTKPVLQSNVLRLLQELNRVSPLHHDQVRDELMRKINQLSVLDATIAEVHPTHLVVTSKYLQRSERIPFEAKGIKEK